MFTINDLDTTPIGPERMERLGKRVTWLETEHSDDINIIFAGPACASACVAGV